MAVYLSLFAGAGQQFFTNAGVPLAGGKIYTYGAGGSTPQATYTTSAGNIAHSNPIVLDAAGRVPGGGEIWLTDTLVYKFQLETSTGTIVQTLDNVSASIGSAALVASSGSNLIGFIQAGSGATARTAQSKMRDAVSVKDFGAVGDGVANDTTAIQNALNVNGAIFFPKGTYKTTAALSVPANTVVFGAGMGATTISCTNGNVSQFVTAGNECVFRDFTINVTASGTTSQIGGINILNSSYCTIQNVEIIGVSWAGVFISGTSSNNIVQDNYFHGFQGSIQDSSDVCIGYGSGNTSYNIVQNNRCYGGNYVGVLILGGSGANPQYNIVSGNRIGQHSTYGIADYRTSDLDSFSQFIGNYIENIQGTTLGGTSGAGIYCVATGGSLISGNTINNCCVQTIASTLAPAGIGINGVAAGLNPINIIGNVIENMTKFEGILIVSSANGCNIIGNRIRMPTNTTGSGAIYINASSNVLIATNNIIVSPTTGTTVSGIFVNASSAISNICVTNNILIGGNAGAIRFFSSSHQITGATINGNAVYGGGIGTVGLQLSKIVGGTVTGNNCSVTTTKAIFVTDCTYLRMANNYLITSGTNAFSSSGTCTGSYFDKTNYWNATMDNSATGLIVEWLNNAAPATGNWAVGDRTEQSVPVVGNPKGWRCTVAGTPGTWVSEGNL